MRIPSSPTLLLSVASVGLLSLGARAADRSESSLGDLSNTSPGTGVDYSTYQSVSGSESDSDVADYFELTNLPAGGTFNFTLNYTVSGSIISGDLVVTDSADTPLISNSGLTSSGSYTPGADLTVPTDGILRFGLTTTWEGSGNFGYSFSFTSTAPETTNNPVPEASTTAAGAVVGLAALLARRRQKRVA